MKWDDREESENVEDRRGIGAKTGLAIGGGAGGIIILLIALFLGVDPQKLGNLLGPTGGGGTATSTEPRVADPAEERLAKFSKIIFHDTEVVWSELFEKLGKKYRNPTLVLFT